MPDEHDAAHPEPAPEEVQPEAAEPTEIGPKEIGHGGSHEAPDGAPVHPLIDLSRDPTPGKPDHARPDDD